MFKWNCYELTLWYKVLGYRWINFKFHLFNCTVLKRKPQASNRVPGAEAHDTELRLNTWLTCSSSPSQILPHQSGGNICGLEFLDQHQGVHLSDRTPVILPPKKGALSETILFFLLLITFWFCPVSAYKNFPCCMTSQINHNITLILIKLHIYIYIIHIYWYIVCKAFLKLKRYVSVEMFKNMNA